MLSVPSTSDETSFAPATAAAKSGDCGCGCDKGGDKGDAPIKVEDDDKEAPMPPAPVVDPSAFLNQHRVIHASTTVVR